MGLLNDLVADVMITLGSQIETIPMSFYSQYELVRLVCQARTKTFEAKQLASNRLVYLHLFDDDPAVRDSLLEKIGFLVTNPPASGPLPILDVVQSAESPYAVTEILDPFTNLEDWVEAQYHKIDQADKSQWREQIDSRLWAGDQEGALEVARDALIEHPEDNDLRKAEQVLDRLCRGRQLCAEGNEEEGLELLSQARRIDEQNQHVRNVLTTCLIDAAEKLIDLHWEAADNHVEQALQLDPNHERAQGLRERIGHKREEFICWCLTQAHRLQSQGDRAGAIVVVEQGLASYPQEQRLLELKASLQRKAEPSPSKPTSKTLGKVRSLRGYVEKLKDKLQAKLRKLAPKLSKLAAYLRDRLAPLVPLHLQARQRWLLPVLVSLLATLTVIAVLLGTWSTDSEPPPEVALAPPPVFSVIVKADPPDAAISIDSEMCGTSTCRVELEQGRYRADAELLGYDTATRFFDVDEQSSGQQEPIVLSLTAQAPTLQLSSDLARGEVSLDGELLGELEDGQLEAELNSLESGEHILAVSGDGSRAEIRFESSPGSAAKILGPLDTRNLKAILVSGLGREARLHSSETVKDARLNGEPLEEVGAEGAALNNLWKGEHELTLGTGRRERTVLFDRGERPYLAAFLRSHRPLGALRISTGEDGTSVFLNGKRYRRETRNGRLFIYLHPKQYRVRVEKEGFVAPAERVVDIRKDEQVRLNFSMVQRPQAASLRVSGGPPGTEVLLDGQDLGRISPNGTFASSEIAPGGHEIVLRHDRYLTKVVARDFAAGTTVEIDGALEREPGTLRINIIPPDLNVALTLRRDGETAARAISDKTLSLSPGTYTVGGKAAGYRDYAATARLDPGQSKTLSLIMELDQSQGRQEPVSALEEWGKGRGWMREGPLLVRRGGNFVLAPIKPGPGTYSFTAIVKKGRRLEWVVNYRDEGNYLLYQLGKNFFHRIEVREGQRSSPVRLRHDLHRHEFVTVHIEVTGDSIVQRAQQNGRSVLLDEWKHSGAGFTRGRFGFHVPGRDQIALREMSFIPRSG